MIDTPSMKFFKSLRTPHRDPEPIPHALTDGSTWPAWPRSLDARLPDRAIPYAARTAPPAELVEILQKVVHYSRLIRPEAKDQVLAHLCGGEALQINLSPLSDLELRLLGLRKKRTPVFRGLLDILTDRALSLREPAGVPGALSVQAALHWARAQTVGTLLAEAAHETVRLVGCSGGDHCAWCAALAAAPRPVATLLVDEMIAQCTCHPYCAGHLVTPPAA